ncbi:hypothetical protein CCMA1212_003081 [Trichoderma ghanense]|uniref:Uncharacterized protein n=1 Tax=Trichoderma ghanense TaxID=65468 RepID=A0ABY2HCS8_9HYPO
MWGLSRRQLGLLLVGDNLVAHGVELLLLIVVLLEAGAGTLALDPVVAGRSHLAVHDSPDFLSQVLGELGRVSDDDDTTLELLQGLGQGTQRVTVQVVGRLVKDDQVGSLPRASSQDSLDTLATRQTAHLRVRDQLGIQTEVGAVGLNLLSDQRSELTGGEGLLHVDIGDHLLVRGQQLVTRQPNVVGAHHGNPALVLHADVLTQSERTLVFVAVLELSAGVDANDTTLSTLDLEDLVHGLLIGLGDDLVGSVHGLTILTSLETPLDVLGRRLVEVVVDVGKGVLLDVGDTDVLVLVDLTASGDELTAEDVDQGRLASTVGTNDGNTRAQRALEADVADLGLRGAGVLEGHLGGTQDSLGLGLDTLEETGLGEGELNLGGAELVVGLGRRNTLDELLQVTTVALELESLVVDDVLADVVEEARVVRDDDGSAGGVDEVVLEPLDILHVQVVGGLVEKQDIGGLEDGTAQSQLHLPTTRQSGNLALDHLLGEAELNEALLDVLLRDLDLGLGQLLHGPVNGGHLSVGGVKVVLDEDGLDLALLGEALDLLVVDGTHEGRLAGTVGTAETVTLTALEAEVGLVEQDLGTVGKREGAVAEILALLVIGLALSLLGSAGRSTLAQSVDSGLSVVDAGDDGNVGLQALDPDKGVGLLHVDELAGNGGNVLSDRLHLLEQGSVAGGQDLLELGKDDLDIAVVAGLGDLAVDDVADTAKGVEGLLGLLTSLGIGKGVVVLLEAGNHLVQEGSDDVGVVDELAHVVNNDSRLSLDGGVVLLETTAQQRDHESKGGLLDLGDEGGGTEKVDSLGDPVGLSNTLDELGNESLDILVDDELADVLHDLVGNTVGKLSRSLLDQSEDEVQSSHLGGRLGLILLDGGHDARQSTLDGITLDGLGDSQDSGVGRARGSLSVRGLGLGSALLLVLVLRRRLRAGSGQQLGQKNDEVGLDIGAKLRMTGNVLDGNGGPVTSSGVLLVGEALLEIVDDSIERTC